MNTFYRIIDLSNNTIVAQSLTYEQASESIRLYELDYPHTKFVIESYTVS